MDRDLAAAAGLEVALEEVGADVVAVRQLQRPHLHRQCSFGPRLGGGPTRGTDWEGGVGRAGLGWRRARGKDWEGGVGAGAWEG